VFALGQACERPPGRSRGGHYYGQLRVLSLSTGSMRTRSNRTVLAHDRKIDIIVPRSSTYIQSFLRFFYVNMRSHIMWPLAIYLSMVVDKAAGRRMQKVRKSDRTRAAILDAAQKLFAEHGHERTTVRDIAAKASVDPALVIRYFGSKDELFVRAAAFEL